MSGKKDIFVYAGWLSNELIGTIHCDVTNGNEIASYEYDRKWLIEHSSLMLDPTIPQVTYRLYSADKQLFGAFEDSCPDRWGRKLIDRRETLYAIKEKRAPKKFFESDYLLGIQDCYCNSPEVVARASKNVMKDYLHSFKYIEYAVYCNPKDDTNYRTFERVLRPLCK